MIMKRSVILMTMMCLAVLGFASVNVENNLTLPATSSQQTLYEMKPLLPACVKKDCTVKLDFTLESGAEVKGEITFVDVSWWDCTKIQVAAWFARTF